MNAAPNICVLIAVFLHCSQIIAALRHKHAQIHFQMCFQRGSFAKWFLWSACTSPLWVRSNQLLSPLLQMDCCQQCFLFFLFPTDNCSEAKNTSQAVGCRAERNQSVSFILFVKVFGSVISRTCSRRN